MDAAARPSSSSFPAASSSSTASLAAPPLPPLPPAAVAPSSSAAASLQKEPPPTGGVQRLWFSVALKPGETTIVSWKRLLKDNGKGQWSPPVAAPADRPLAAQSGEVAAGNQSSDEELDDIPDDDQYDTEDSFIDDAELDEYFQIDKMSTKHNGYFVNKGKLEQM